MADRRAVIGTPEAVPGQAVMAVRQHLIKNGCTVPLDVLREALAKAEPSMAAAERLRLAALPDDYQHAWIEADPQAPGHNRGVFDFTAAIAQAVVRERERCAQLAERHEAYTTEQWTHRRVPKEPFADLLRSTDGT